MAGGFDLAVMCDIRLASENALFGHPELRFGSPVLYGLLKEAVGGGMARDLCLSGRNIDAAEAHRIGLLSKVTSPDKLMEESKAMLEEICKSPLNALINEKKMIMKSAREAIDDATSSEGQSFVDVIREGMK
jgi:enoyl-CoA hydratase